jgi:hypothetical protein
MDFSGMSLLPNERVIWSAQIQRQRENEAVRSAPPVIPKPMMAGSKKKHKVKDDPCADPGEFSVNDQQAIRALREKWKIGL